MSSHLIKNIVSDAAAAAAAGGIALSDAGSSPAAVSGITNNWSDWGNAHAEAEIFNNSQRLQSVAHLGNTRHYGEPWWSYSVGHVNGYSWTHKAYRFASPNRASN